jgi:hypothetical protein
MEFQRRAAEHGDGFAQLQRGVMLVTEHPGRSTDFAEAADQQAEGAAQTALAR